MNHEKVRVLLRAFKRNGKTEVIIDNAVQKTDAHVIAREFYDIRIHAFHIPAEHRIGDFRLRLLSKRKPVEDSSAAAVFDTFKTIYHDFLLFII